jgi:hypothetical protein
LAASILFTPALAFGDEQNPKQKSTFVNQIQPIFRAYCVDCHSGDDPEGDMQIVDLNPDFINGNDVQRWHAMLDALNRGEMPPEDEKQPSAQQRQVLVDWITAGLSQARKHGRGKIEPIARRLNRQQYNNTLRDLLHLNLDVGSDLPNDAISREGFNNNGEALIMSSLHMEYYMKAARSALNKSIFTEERPTIHHFRVELGQNINPDINPNKERVQLGFAANILKPEDYRYSEPKLDKPFPHVLYQRPTKYTFNEGYNGNSTVKGQRSFDEIFHSVFVDLRRAKGKYTLRDDSIELKPSIARPGARAPTLKVVIREYPLEGNFVVRVKASRVSKTDGNSSEDAPGLVAYIGVRRDDGEGFSEVGPPQPVTSTEPQVYEFHGRFEEMTMPNYEADNDHYLGNLMHVGVYNEAIAGGYTENLKIHAIELEAPYFASWPPKSHSSIFVESPNNVVSPNTSDRKKYAQEIIRNFLTRAYRRPPTKSELELVNSFWSELQQEKNATFEDSIKEALVIALSSPQFLYIHEPATESRRLTEYELATRLSYFLWDSMPDTELFELAAASELRNHLPQQVSRMISDPRSKRFASQFAKQWLDVDRMDRTVVYRRSEYTKSLAVSMKQETVEFMLELLQTNESVLRFVDSNFVVINDKLAKLYGIDEVEGNQFRRVAIAKDSQRGGVLTHASILTGHSSGRDSHPVKRGVWLAKKILGNPPPDPPPGVPPLDEEDPKLTKLPLKQQLEIHRNNDACRNCHKKIDPWGVAFENYDTIGKYRRDKSHEATATLPDGEKIDGLRDLKNYILAKRSKDVANSFTKHLASYALGRSLSFADDDAIDKIVDDTSEREYRIQDVIVSLVTSELFLNR